MNMESIKLKSTDMCSFLRHMDTVFKALPYLDSSAYSLKAVNAYRLAKKEFSKIYSLNK